jgi:hypothetical protein
MKNLLQLLVLVFITSLKAQTVGFYAGSTGGDFGYLDANGTAARFGTPFGLNTDGAGNIYVAEASNHKIRKIDNNGNVTTVAGTTSGYLDGNISVAKFNTPSGIAIDAVGNIFVADTNNNKIRKIDTNGNVTTIAGSTSGFLDGNGIAAKFKKPFRIAIGATNSLFVTDRDNSVIRKIDSNNEVTTFAGSVYGYQDGTGNTAKFASPMGIFIDANFDMYITDQGNQKIRKILPDGTVSTIASDVNGFGLVKSIDGNIYVSDVSNNCIRKINGSGIVSVFAGNANIPTNNNGGFLSPYDIVQRPNGSLYVADATANNIKTITQILNAVSFFETKVRFYPNPTSSQINLTFENKLENASIKIISILGQTVLEKQNLSGNNLSLDVSTLSKGIYILELNDGVSLTNSKFIKE